MSVCQYTQRIRCVMVAICLSAAGGFLTAADSTVIYEGNEPFSPANKIDELMVAGWKESGVSPAKRCSDAVFIRRVYLDMLGILPEPDEVRTFLRNDAPDKRAALIDALMQRDEFADYWAQKWCDILRVKAEFPINLWPNAVQAYARWIRQSLHDNMACDDFARQLLTASGSNFRVPPVNFYRAVQGHKPATLAAAAAQTFMGVRLQNWPEPDRAGLEALFAHVSFKGTAEWKEEIVLLNPAMAEAVTATMPDGRTLVVPPGKDPRQAFADWLIQPDNPWFTRSIVNRIWAWLFGRGLIHECDDIRDDNPAVHPAVLTHLQKELVASDYDLRHIYRLILNSSTYQQSPVPQGDPVKASAAFACYPVRRLDAEVLIDALCRITGTKERYHSMIPEPYTFVPPEHRSVQLSDGSITSRFLKLFGRPSRDTGLESERSNEISEAQMLHMLNSTHIGNKLTKGGKIRGLYRRHRGKSNRFVGAVYLHVLSRFPTPAERLAINDYIENNNTDKKQAMMDLVWALVNTKEFLYRH